MTSVPTTIPDVGSTEQKPQINAHFNPTQHGLSSEDYYVLTRIDGTTSLKQLILMVGLGVERGVDILQRLRKVGAYIFQGEDGREVSARVLAAAKPKIELTAEESVAMAIDVDLDDDEKQQIIEAKRLVEGHSYYEVLGVDADAGKRDLKRAYFRLSKDFHPDRFYGKDVGPFAPWLERIFRTVTKAFDVLSDAKAREAYDAALRGEEHSPSASQSQSKEEHAADLFSQACQNEVAGNLEQAMTLFRAVIRLAPSAKFLGRAARAAMAAGQLEEGLEFACKARDLRPKDPSYWRVVAAAHQAAGNYQEAEQVLVVAVTLRTENDALAGGLQSDLEEIRRLLNRS